MEIFDEEASGEDYSGSDGEGENSEEENDHTDGEAEQTKEDCMQLSSTDLKTSKGDIYYSKIYLTAIYEFNFS